MKKILGLIATFCLLCLVCSNAVAQNDVIKGTVVTESGEPVFGAAIMVKGAPGRGAITDDAGHYTISAAKGETLEYTCIGNAPPRRRFGNGPLREHVHP